MISQALDIACNSIQQKGLGKSLNDNLCQLFDSLGFKSENELDIEVINKLCHLISKCNWKSFQRFGQLRWQFLKTYRVEERQYRELQRIKDGEEPTSIVDLIKRDFMTREINLPKIKDFCQKQELSLIDLEFMIDFSSSIVNLYSDGLQDQISQLKEISISTLSYLTLH